MVIRHKIIEENGKQILYVYLDENLEEFARDSLDNKEERDRNLAQQISDYIKEKNINFNGKVVKVLAGSFLIATLYLNLGATNKVSAQTSTETSYVVKAGDSLYSIANNYGLSVTELKEMNNKTTNTILPGETLTVATIKTDFYTVVSGDSLYGIAKNNNLSVSELKDINNLTSDYINPGQLLLVNPNSEIGTYTVQSGDTLYKIANMYGMSVNDLKAINNTRDNIYIGQKLKVIQAKTVKTTTYTVKQGDSLYSIAKAHNMTVSQLQSVNNIGTTIYPGQVLNVTGDTVIEKDIEVRVVRSNGAVQTISLEQYVTGVVSSELGPGFNKEAYKAQALAARTYAVKRVEAGQTLTDTDTHQVYRDVDQLKKLWGNNFNTYYNEINSAVLATKGQVISYNGELIDALFFSTSNGYTEDPVYVWGGSLPYLKPVDSSYDRKSPYYSKTSTFTYSEFATRLGLASTNNLYANVLSRTSGHGVNTINISGRTFSGNYVRSKLRLNSTDFTITFSNGKVIITQRGWGHRVGLSQYGAHFMGEQGFSYEQIIKHYYQGVDIVNR